MPPGCNSTLLLVALAMRSAPWLLHPLTDGDAELVDSSHSGCVAEGVGAVVIVLDINRHCSGRRAAIRHPPGEGR